MSLIRICYIYMSVHVRVIKALAKPSMFAYSACRKLHPHVVLCGSIGERIL
jgi:hypothetical protein